MSVANTLRLDDQLCFALYSATNAITRAYRSSLREINLTYPQYLVMMALWEQDGQSVNEVAERLRLPGNAVTPVLGRLEHVGYVTRSRDASDARVVSIRLTPAGADLEHAAAAVQRQVACRTGLDEVSLAALRARLHDLVDDMRAPAACEGSFKGEVS